MNQMKGKKSSQNSKPSKLGTY